MRAAKRALLGIVTTVATTAALVLAPTAASAAPTAPTITSIKTTGAGGQTFTTSPAAGTSTTPEIAVGGVVANDVVSLYQDGALASSCTAVGTTATFNKVGAADCVGGTPVVLTNDKAYSFTATRSQSAVASPQSDAFEYDLDRVAPVAPTGVTATPKKGADIQVQFNTANDTAGPGASGVTNYKIYRSQPNPPTPATATYTSVATIALVSCGGSVCTYLDHASTPGGDPSNGNSYSYEATAVDKAGNEGPKSSPSGAAIADGQAPPAPSGLTVTDNSGDRAPDAGFGNDTTPHVHVNLSAGEAKTLRLIINNVQADVQAVSGAATSFDWNNPTNVVNFGDDGLKTVFVTADDSLGNRSTSSSVDYTLDTAAPASPGITVSNSAGPSVDSSDSTPQVVVSGVENLEYALVNVSKVSSADGTATDFTKTSTGSDLTWNIDGCGTIAQPTTACDFTLGGTQPRPVYITPGAADRAGNLSSGPVITYTWNNSVPDLSNIDSMNGDTTSPASGADRTPPMVVRVSVPGSANDVTHIDIFRGSEISPIGSQQVAGHTLTCASPAAGQVCVGLNQTAGAQDLTVSTGTNILKARAYNAAGKYLDSAPFQWDAIDNQAPAAPGKPTASLADGGTITVDWNDVNDTVDAHGDTSPPITYDITRASGAPDSGGVCPSSGSLTFTPLASGLTTSNYTDPMSPTRNCVFYRVRAVDAASNASGYSVASDASGDRVAPSVPGKPSVTKYSAGHLVVSWAGSTDPSPNSNPVTYDLFRATAAPGTAGNESTCPAAGGLTFTSRANGLSSTSYSDTTTTNGMCTYYQVRANDQAGNSSAFSSSSDAALVNTSSGPPAPSITTVNGSPSSPAYGSVTKPTVVVSFTESGGVIHLFLDGVDVGSKPVPGVGSTVTFTSGDIAGAGAGPRRHNFTANQVLPGPLTSAMSSQFGYTRPPSAPTITEVAGSTTSPFKAAAAQPKVKLSLPELPTSDTVKLYADDDCGGVHSPVLVATLANVAGTAVTINSADWTASLAKGVTYCLTATTTDTTMTDSGTATSASSPSFTFERAPIVSGYILEGTGQVTAIGGAPVITDAPNWGTWDIGRRFALPTSGPGGYVLDGWGGVHPVGGAPALSGTPYWSGWDIARDLVMTSPTGGYVLDGWGGIHNFGGAPAVNGAASWSGWDIARDLVVFPDKTGGYVLDGWGGVHSFGIGANAPIASPASATWSGWDIARSIVLRTNTSGYTLDGWGGIHPFGGAPAAAPSHYTSGSDIARVLTMSETDGDGGYVLDVTGLTSRWGDALDTTRVLTSANRARDLAIITS